jgi:peptide chain release factor 1
MLTKYIEAEKRFLEIEHLLNNTTDGVHKQQLIDEYKALKPLTEAYRTYQKYSSELDYAKDLADSGDDAEMRDLARDEVDILNTRIDDQLHKMKVLLLPKDSRDDRHIFIEIQGSASSREIWQFVYDLTRMYGRYIEAQKWKWKFFDECSHGSDEPKIFLFHVAESGIYQSLKFEQGIHQIVSGNNADSVTTFNISVEVFAVADQNDVQLNMNDVRIEVLRCAYPGGQHIIRVDSGIRLTHIPTGIVVKSTGERSQLKNKVRAKQLLTAKLYRLQNDLSVVAEIVRTYNIEQDSVIDHRLGDMRYSLSNLINGGLHQIINLLVRQDQLRLFKEYNL